MNFFCRAGVSHPVSLYRVNVELICWKIIAIIFLFEISVMKAFDEVIAGAKLGDRLPNCHESYGSDD